MKEYFMVFKTKICIGLICRRAYWWNHFQKFYKSIQLWQSVVKSEHFCRICVERGTQLSQSLSNPPWPNRGFFTNSGSLRSRVGGVSSVPNLSGKKLLISVKRSVWDTRKLHPKYPNLPIVVTKHSSSATHNYKLRRLSKGKVWEKGVCLLYLYTFCNRGHY